MLNYPNNNDVNLSKYYDKFSVSLNKFDELTKNDYTDNELEKTFNTDNICYKEPLEKIKRIYNHYQFGINPQLLRIDQITRADAETKWLKDNSIQ